MKAKERSFFEISKRFLEPLFKEKLITSKAIFMYFIWAIPLVYHIFFIQKIVFHIENNDKNGFIKIIIIYGIVNILYEIISYLVRNWGWVITANTYRKIIHGEYLQKFISLGNTETEKLGTGKLISIMDKGIDIWALLLNSLIENSLRKLRKTKIVIEIF